MLHDFLQKNQADILALTERKSLELAGMRASSKQLKEGLPIFFQQLIEILQLENKTIATPSISEMAKAAGDADEPALAKAGGQQGEVEMAEAAGHHGAELLRLGYTLSHVVHAYGAMCQSVTEVAINKEYPITTDEFRDLNRCLDVAIAGAVTEFQAIRNRQEFSREVSHLGFLVHELRNALASVKISVRLIQTGQVGAGGSVAKVLEKGLNRFDDLIERSLAEVRLNVDPKVRVESVNLLHLVSQITLTADIEAVQRKQAIEVDIMPTVFFDADKDLFYSALTNLIQNAIKYTHSGGTIQIRGSLVGENAIIEVEDECGGLRPGVEEELFKPFVQDHENRKGLGLGLTIAKRAIMLNKGKLAVRNLLGKGCVFTITIPRIFIP